MRRAATHLAQVADASGRTQGLVALEDVLELLVGEVRDPAHREAPGARPETGTHLGSGTRADSGTHPDSGTLPDAGAGIDADAGPAEARSGAPAGALTR